MRLSNKNILKSFLIDLKDDNWLQKQRIAGKITSQTLCLLKSLVVDKTTKNLLELNQIAEDFIIQSGGIPTFKGYKGFPTGVCISVNKHLVHGIPDKSYLKEGDVVSFDLGVTFQGAIADSALTCIYGQPKDEHIKLIEATEESLAKGIESIKIGKRLGVIGNSIYKCAKSHNFKVITNYGGHGLTWNTPHTAPFVDNKSDVDSGIRIQAGLTIAIEPMLVIGYPETRVLSDGWTVVTNDIGSHAEHSVYIHQDKIEVLTYREDEKYLKSNIIYFKD